jgi:hypothetical protein
LVVLLDALSFASLTYVANRRISFHSFSGAAAGAWLFGRQRTTGDGKRRAISAKTKAGHDPDAKLGKTCFIVRDASRQALAYVYFEEEPGRHSAAHLMTRNEAEHGEAQPSMVRIIQHFSDPPGTRLDAHKLDWPHPCYGDIVKVTSEAQVCWAHQSV